MKPIVSVIVALFACLPCTAENDLTSEFYEGLKKVEAKYRADKASLIKDADRVVVYLVDFDGISIRKTFSGEDDSILIAPYSSFTKVLEKKEVEAEDRKELLDILSTTIAKSEHSGGAFCHFPIHGVRVYAGDELLHEGTFCWACMNFSFSYPQGAGWLDTNADLKAIFAKILPIPQTELDRFYEKFPGKRPKGGQAGAGQPAARPEPESQVEDQPQPEAEGRSR